ncbi:MAG: chitobiase/beta-hexosaminidase C-terminal domain-containing protein, partial [Muribaculaceae bacterium]|nr:chitobiase/beta-hexosaminidase C-terminal domain-containing protein [Muribaculaceae bacterium]
VTGDDMTRDVDMEVVDTSYGAHTFNLRLRNNAGDWGAPYRKVIVFNDADPLRHVVGYRHYINGLDLGYVAVEGSLTDTYAFEVEIPEELGLNVRDKKPLFDGNTVTIGGTDSIRYTMQIETASGWIQPSSWDVVASNSFSATAVEMRVNSHCTLDTPGAGQFAAVKFTAPGQPLYFLSGIPIALDLYKDGEMITGVAASDLTDMTMLELAAGEYFGILHDAQSNNADFVLRIMDTPNAVPSPQISYDDGLVSMSCSRADAEIHYTLDSSTPTIESALYLEPFALAQSAVVKAVAFVPGTDLEPSAVAELEIMLQSAPVTISYNGRYVSIEVDDDDARIFYSLDSSVSEPDTEYQGQFDAMGLATVRAFAVRDGFTNSEVVEYNILGYADEVHAETAVGGVLAFCYDWAGRDMLDNLDRLSVAGRLNDADFSFIRTLGKLRHLDFEDVTDARMPDAALSGLPLVTVNMPSDMTSYGDRVFDACQDLCAIIWNSTSLIVDSRLTEGIANRNILLYIPYRDADGASGVVNRVESGRAQSIVLTDTHPFLAPIEFYADAIHYTRNFSKETLIGSCSGWETLTLPFDVETVSDAVGEAVPFAKAQSDDRPFWLYRPTGNGWESTDVIRAYEPYLISMPNNPNYAEHYNIRGDVVFSASGVQVGVTPEPEGYAYKGGAQLWPCFNGVEADGSRWVVNDDWFENDVPGSVFVSGLRAARPFECYLTSDSNARRIPVFDRDAAGIEEIKTEGSLKIWVDGSDVCLLSSADRRISVYNTVGVAVKTIDLVSGETVRLTDLSSGLYIIANQKIILY